MKLFYVYIYLWSLIIASYTINNADAKKVTEITIVGSNHYMVDSCTGLVWSNHGDIEIHEIKFTDNNDVKIELDIPSLPKELRLLDCKSASKWRSCPLISWFGIDRRTTNELIYPRRSKIAMPDAHMFYAYQVSVDFSKKKYHTKWYVLLRHIPVAIMFGAVFYWFIMPVLPHSKLQVSDVVELYNTLSVKERMLYFSGHVVIIACIVVLYFES